MIQIVVTDLGTVEKVQRTLSGLPRAIRTVVRRSNVDTIRAVRGAIPKVISDRYVLTKSQVRADMNLSVRSQDSGMIMALVVSGRRLPVYQFGVLPRSVPPQLGVPVAQRIRIAVETIRGRLRVGRPNRFLAKMPKSGHVGLFYRTAGSKSLPIRESMEDSIPEMLRVSSVKNQIVDRAREILTRSLERNLQVALNPKP